MNDFLKILSHGKRLQVAVKELSLDELIVVVEKLNNIIEKRKLAEEKAKETAIEKESTVNEILRQLQDAGLELKDLQAKFSVKKSTRVGQKRPVKYILTDAHGSAHPWTGIGRMPKVYAAALAEGNSLDSFKI
ncbi:MAG: DNA-binding protein H-NS [Paraglaciecola sp.]|jgi:DNA-binding protein H-NS